LILIGFAAALRRSELVALDVNDIARHPKGLVVTIRRSKTDQAGAGKTKAIPHGRKLHAVHALEAWLVAAGITSGPVFRGVRGNKVRGARLCEHQVARIMQKRATAVGLDPTLFAGHSCARATFRARPITVPRSRRSRITLPTRSSTPRTVMCRSATPSATIRARVFSDPGCRFC
jgi:integrase